MPDFAADFAAEFVAKFVDILALPHDARAEAHVVGWRHGKAVTNASFKHDIHRWRQLLQSHPGQRFALYLQDTIDFAAVLFGAWLAGKTIYLPGDALPATCQALAAEVDGFIGEVEAEWQPLQLADPATIAGDDKVDAPLAGDFPGLVVYTSGSTGTAQAIPKKLVQLTHEVATLERLFGQQLQQCDIVATISHQHIYGLLFKVLWPLAAGRAIHAHSAFFPEDLAACAPSDRPWLLLSSPAHLKRLPGSPVQADVRCLRAVFSSGGPLLQDVSLAVQQLFRHVPIEIYGSSETGGIAWRQVAPAADAGSNALDDRWQTMPEVDVRADADDECLQVRSPHLPDDHWHRMADQVVFEAGQPTRFLLRGRADRIVKLEEKRISLDQMERLLLASPWVAEVRVLMHAAQRAHQRDRIAAFVVLNAAGQQQLQQAGKLTLNRKLRAQLAGTIAHLALPRQWRYLAALPSNAQGKTTNAALLALLDDDHIEDSSTTPGALSTTASTVTLPPPQNLQQHSATQVSLSLHVPADLLYFRGHFANTPILPGVVQLDWALTLGRRYLDLPPRCIGMQALKFQHVIRPGNDIMLELEHDVVKSALVFRFHSSAGQHASGRILLGQQ